MDNEEKYCPSCTGIKPRIEFRKDRTKKDGLSSSCKKCRDDQNARWKRENPEQYKNTQQKFRENLEKDPARSAKRKAYNKMHSRMRYIQGHNKKLYNLTYDEFLGLLEHQEHKCAICQKPETCMGNNGAIRTLAIDHDHTTGEVRGLLCFTCNTNLGILENEALLSTAIPYLIKCNSNPETVQILKGIQQYLESKTQGGELA